jgi:phosphoribosylaminoimidazole carboxylase PurE protein
MSGKNLLVGVVMGSSSDRDVMQGCTDILNELEISHEVRILSAHRTPDRARDYALSASERGIEVIIAGAGWAAHLAGFMAAHTLLPVIGIPIDSSPLQGIDALLATVQMPPGIPVATVALGNGGAKNAAVLSAQILALKYPEIAEKLKLFREQQSEKVIKSDVAIGA